MEYVSAHATYRFIIRDEEEERGRILVSTTHWCVELSKSVNPISQDLAIQTEHADIILYYYQPCRSGNEVHLSCEGIVQITCARRCIYRSQNVRPKQRFC